MLEDALAQRTKLSKGTPQSYELGTKEYIDEQNAAMQANAHRQRAADMEAWLANALHAGNVDPETFKSMQQTIQRHDKMADMVEQRQERAKERRIAEQQNAEDRVADAYKTGIAAEVGADERAIRKRQQDYREIQNDIDRLHDKWVKANGAEKDQYMARLVSKYREASALQGQNISAKEAQIMVMYELGQMDEEEAATALEALGASQ